MINRYVFSDVKKNILKLFLKQTNEWETFMVWSMQLQFLSQKSFLSLFPFLISFIGNEMM